MISTTSASTLTISNIGGRVCEYIWNWQGKQFKIAYETRGSGQPVLLLPAFSSVSTRGEMAGIAGMLSSQFQVLAFDWLGFGESERPNLDYNPALYQQLLEDFVKSIFNVPIIIIAAGHATGYATKLASKIPNLVTKIILIAPTWRGPLRVMGVPSQIRSMVKQMVYSPGMGQILYQLNTTSGFLRFMYSRHVYVNESKLTPEFITQKRQITQQPGARFAPAAFVTGGIDPVEERTDLTTDLQSLSIPKLVIISEQAPPASLAEMQAIAALPGVEKVCLTGTLGIHEEYSANVGTTILSFLSSPHG
ncbi:alpha/beta fold hydrolase [Calothrix rhizosoleniae]|uniref:alpha/beta fold hydrolase n=1 Tax=Calothrix rhizosoleniae TaxID=888997 RepID=UPI000B4A1090|nr:alpha/beta fold hydrolase [Calothrix rhizosoleniae]